ncbi:hypothetical protein [Cohaesibacter celericrescens]|uniref:hypothetical protein n=1 Tax=Cohaesibacter celericrescens TaxID=2067669 RepID=UPI00356587EB
MATETIFGLSDDPACTTRIHSPFTMDDIKTHVEKIKHLRPEEPRSVGLVAPLLLSC